MNVLLFIVAVCYVMSAIWHYADSFSGFLAGLLGWVISIGIFIMIVSSDDFDRCNKAGIDYDNLKNKAKQGGSE